MWPCRLFGKMSLKCNFPITPIEFRIKHKDTNFNICRAVSFPYYLYSNFMGKFKSCLKIFRLQKRALRVIAGINNSSTQCQSLFLKFGIMSLPSLYIYFSVIEIHKNISNFNTQSDTHSYRTRSADLLRTNRFSLKNLKIIS